MWPKMAKNRRRGSTVPVQPRMNAGESVSPDESRMTTRRDTDNTQTGGISPDRAPNESGMGTRQDLDILDEPRTFRVNPD